MNGSLRWTPGAVVIPAPTLKEGASLLFLWARFTGRLQDTAPAAAVDRSGPSGRYVIETL